MNRLALSLAALAALGTSAARADTLPLIVGAPTTYTVGVPFDLELRAPGVVDFAAYSLELVFATENDATGAISLTATNPGVGTAFSGVNFASSSSTSSDGLETRLAVADLGPPVSTTSGVNDLLAVIRVTVTAPLGSITLSVNPDTLFFDINRESTPFIDPPQPITISGPGPNDPQPPPPVPAPAGLVAAGIGLAVLAVRRRVVG